MPKIENETIVKQVEKEVSEKVEEKTGDAIKPDSDIPTKSPSLVVEQSVLAKKHLLKNTWALWHLEADRDKEWEMRLKLIYTFNTIEDFWALYNNIRPPTGLQWTADYNLFKENIRPMWEEKENKCGGRWLIPVIQDNNLLLLFPIDKMRHHDLLDISWLEVLLAIIGEQFGDYNDEICGAVANVRNKGDKVCIWTRDADNQAANYNIGLTIKNILSAVSISKQIGLIRYEDHGECKKKSGSTARARITI